MLDARHFGHYALVPVVRSEGYERPALEWMLAQVSRLRFALAEAGVVDESTQRAVCVAFFFGLAVEFDDDEVSTVARPRPRLAFENGDRVLLPDDGTFEFHVYVHGVVGDAFGDT